MQFVIAVLAAFRITRLLVEDDGPNDVFDKIRARAGAYEYGEDGRECTDLGRIFGCPYCMGIYISLFVTALMGQGNWKQLFIFWFAVAGGQSFLQKVADGTESQGS